eukprot:TRINITY_DN9764_c0_g1_i1.p1 TRINITY_DN9764_c0_g1~~TRINITY_DN9764_c0_g1_i1.p1  ORF type:complete len:432 (-),score=49.28 TRINITY_DN9764_c0_g1_i1:136-1365(-)
MDETSSGDEAGHHGSRLLAGGRGLRPGLGSRRLLGVAFVVLGTCFCGVGFLGLLSSPQLGDSSGGDVEARGASGAKVEARDKVGDWFKNLVRPKPHPHPVPHPAPAPPPWQPPPADGEETRYSESRRRYMALPELPAKLPKPDYSLPKAPVYEFYAYRAQSSKEYDLENVNMANIAGVMWYLHNEIVPDNCNRRFDIRRILRVKVKTTATPELWAKQMNFGVRYAFDSGKCTGPEHCEETWKRYGYVVGCNNLGEFPYPEYETFYPQGVWYSFPGKCSQHEFGQRASDCAVDEPGGKCEGTPTGARDCTYSFEPAGEINIDELVGIYGGHENFCNRGCYEYKRSTQSGSCTDFWNHKWTKEKNEERVRKAIRLFAQKYPDTDATLPEPLCDYDNKRAFSPNGLSGRPAP